MRLILILILCLTGCKNDKPIDERDIRSIYWTTLKVSEQYKTHRFPSIIYSGQYSELSFQTSGELQPLNAVEGKLVGKGDIIAILDNEAHQLKLLEGKSNVNTAKFKFIQIKNE